MPHALSALPGGNLLDRATCGHRQRLLLENVGRTGVARRFVLGLGEEPVFLRFARPAVHADEMPAATQFFARQSEIEVAFFKSLVRITFRVPRPAIPDQPGAAAIFPLRDGSLESVVFNRVVLDVDGETLLARDQAWPARDRPALHHAVQL